MRIIKKEARIIAKKIGKEDIAEDLTQDALLYFYKRFTNDENFRQTWNTSSVGERKTYLGTTVKGIIYTATRKYNVVPTRLLDRMVPIWAAQKAIARESGVSTEDVTDAQIAARLGYKVERVKKLREKYAQFSSVHSLEETRGPDDDEPVLQLPDQNFEGDSQPSLDEEVGISLETRRLKEIMEKCLSKTQQYVLIEYNKDKTFEEIATGVYNQTTQQKGVSRERARQIYNSALRTMRNELSATEQKNNKQELLPHHKPRMR